MNIVLASNNAGKIREFSELLKNLPITIMPQSTFGISAAEETGLSFVENALIKARYAARLTGLPAIADDSGLTVTALNGAPGIHSARYAGCNATAEDNMHQLLVELASVPEAKRQASFYCALVFVAHANDPTPLICTGKWSGLLLSAPRGEAGFGYDPLFYIPSEKKTAAELPLAIKNKISHRGIALHSLLTLLPEKI
jgi:XTP/dITP diphosphohydrolase